MSIDSGLEQGSGSIHLPPPGTVIADRFRIIEMVGRGGMGVVFRAEHVNLQKEVAVKMLLGDFERDGANYKRFHTEARIASMLDHPNIVRVHDFGVLGNGYPFLAMDFLAGRSLDDDLKLNVTLPLDRFRQIFLQTCDALEHAHQEGVIHRDIKPSNIMLVTRGKQNDVVKIVDFGLVKVKSADGKEQKLTSTNTLVGSPLFMSPEQCRGMDLDQRSDIYSLGCVMYRALTGHLPISGDNPLDTLYKHVSEPPVPMHKANPNAKVPPQLECLVMKALCKTPDARQQSMEELRAELERALPGDAVTVPASSSRMPVYGSAVPQQPQPQAHTAANVSRLRESAIFHTAAPTPPDGVRVDAKRGGSGRWRVVAAVATVLLGAVFFSAAMKESAHPVKRPVQPALPQAPPRVVASVAPAPPKAHVDPKPPVPVSVAPVKPPVQAIKPVKPVETESPQEKALALEKQGDKQVIEANFDKARGLYQKALQLRDDDDEIGPTAMSSMPLIAKLIQTSLTTHTLPLTTKYFYRFCECWTLHSNNPMRGNREAMRQMSNVAVYLSASKLRAGDMETAKNYMNWAYTFADGDAELTAVVEEHKHQLAEAQRPQLFRPMFMNRNGPFRRDGVRMYGRQ